MQREICQRATTYKSSALISFMRAKLKRATVAALGLRDAGKRFEFWWEKEVYYSVASRVAAAATATTATTSTTSTTCER